MKKKRKPIIGIMGPGSPDDPSIPERAEELGRRIAQQNWILLTGGRKAGVMHAASKGAAEVGGEVLGILPGHSQQGMSDYVTIPIVTGMGSARNVINILSADVVIVCGMGLGTASEASLAIKHQKQTVFIGIDDDQFNFFQSLSEKRLYQFDDPGAVIGYIDETLSPPLPTG